MDRSWLSVCLVTLCFLSFATVVFGTPPDIPSETPFSSRWPWITGATINDGFYHNGTFYLVGDEGTFMSSEDGETWKVCSSPVDGNYPYASYTNQFYIHSDAFGTVAFSETGDCRNTTFWSTTTQNFTVNLIDMQVAPELVPEDWISGFIGIVDFKVYQSSSGKPEDWYKLDVVDPDSGLEAWGVSYADEKWVIKFADVSSGFAPFPIFFSESRDRIDWSPLTSTPFTASYDYSLSYCTGSKKWISIVSEGIITSADSYEWTLELDFPNEYSTHTAACHGDRCVFANTFQLYETLSCGSNWYNETSPKALSNIQQGFPLVSDTGTFIVAGEYGGVYMSKTTLLWEIVGAVAQDAANLEGCTEVIPMKDTFIVACPHSSLVSNEEISTWRYYPYSIDVNDQTDIQLSNYAYGQGILLALGARSEIFTSDDDSEEWDHVASLKVSNSKIAELDNLLHDVGSDSWIGFGRVLWSASEGNEEYVPVIAASPNGFGWKLFAPNYWISSAVYSPIHKKWIGAGPSGLFIADSNYYQWKPVSQVQGSCTKVLANYNFTKFIAQCTNLGAKIYKFSTNLKDWDNYYVPCGLTMRPPETLESCSGLSYVQGWDRFVFFSTETQGVSYSTAKGAEWERTIFPYSMTWIGITSIRDTILTLTKGAILSGTDDWLAYITPEAIKPYTDDLGVLPEPPGFAVTGELAVINESQFETGSSESDANLNGGSIFGIVVACLFFLFLLFVLVGVIALAIFVVVQLRKHPRERIYLLGEDENEAL